MRLKVLLPMSIAQIGGVARTTAADGGAGSAAGPQDMKKTATKVGVATKETRAAFMRENPTLSRLMGALSATTGDWADHVRRYGRRREPRAAGSDLARSCCWEHAQMRNGRRRSLGVVIAGLTLWLLIPRPV